MIVRFNPPTEADLDQVDQAWFESDAPTNDQAIREIDVEAAAHGLVRVREYWLQVFSLPDGRLVRRGFCYRPERSGFADRLAARRGTTIVGTPSVQIIREMRDE
jgi:hypothetical protein